MTRDDWDSKCKVSRLMPVKEKRKKLPPKVRAILQKEIRSECPFCRSDDVAHFEVHHIDSDRSNDELPNLLMLCPTCHSRIEKGDISREQVERKKHLLAGVNPKNSRNIGQAEIFSPREKAEFEYIFSQLDKTVDFDADSNDSDDRNGKSQVRKGCWRAHFPVLLLLLSAFDGNHETFTGITEFDGKTFDARCDDGLERSFSLNLKWNSYNPLPELIKLGLVGATRRYYHERPYTRKMLRFVLWMEFFGLEPSRPKCSFEQR